MLDYASHGSTLAPSRDYDGARVIVNSIARIPGTVDEVAGGYSPVSGDDAVILEDS